MNNSSVKIDYQKIFESLPGNYLILLPDFTIVTASDAYTASTKTVRENIVGKGVFEVFPDDPNDPQAEGAKNLTASLKKVLESKLPDKMATIRYNIPKPEGGGFEEKYWNVENHPFIIENEVVLIINTPIDVTEKIRADIALQKKIEELKMMNESMINREIKMIELKKEMAVLQEVIKNNNLPLPV